MRIIPSGSGGGTGTVSNFSFTNLNGITGVVTNPGTTPALSISIDNASIVLGKLANFAANTILGNNTAGAATPIAMTVAQTKTLLALVAGDVGLGNVTNNAQTQAAIVPNTVPTAGQILVGNAGNTAYAAVSASGDVTIAATGAQTIANNAVTTAKINNSAVTLAKIANAAANSVLVGSGSAGTGAPYTEITLGTNLSMAAGVLNATGGGLTGVVSDTPGANQNNYAPASLSTANILRIAPTTPVVITGLTTGAAGRELTITHSGSNYFIILADENASSTAGNRFSLRGFSKSQVMLLPGDSIRLVYDNTSARWRMSGSITNGGAPSRWPSKVMRASMGVAAASMDTTGFGTGAAVNGNVGFYSATAVDSADNFIAFTSTAATEFHARWTNSGNGNVKLISGSSSYGGGIFSIRFNPGAVSTNGTQFYGLLGATLGTPGGSANASSMVSMMGIGFDATETAFSMMHNDNAGAATKDATGVNFSVNDIYELVLFVVPNTTSVCWALFTVTSPTTTPAVGVFTTDIPAEATALSPIWWGATKGDAVFNEFRAYGCSFTDWT